MAYELSAGGANVKIRSPWAPIGLGILTLGIYNVVWYYKINREMRDFGAVSNDRGLASTNPAVSVLAITFGWFLFFIPPIVSYINTVNRLQRVERLRGKDPISWGVIILLWLAGFVTLGLAALAVPYILQQHLNGVWLDYDPNPSVHQVAGQPPAVLGQDPIAPPAGPAAAAPSPQFARPQAPPPPPPEVSQG